MSVRIKVLREDVLNHMLEYMTKENIFCTRIDGSKFIPLTVDEIPSMLKQSRSKFYNQSYQRVRYLKAKTVSSSKITKKKAPKPLDLGAERKEALISVTKNTRVQDITNKKLVVNWPTMTCTIEGSLITVDFKI
jgi:hypothetical protein